MIMRQFKFIRIILLASVLFWPVNVDCDSEGQNCTSFAYPGQQAGSETKGPLGTWLMAKFSPQKLMAEFMPAQEPQE